MKAIASAAFAIASSIGVCIAAGSLASVVLANPEAHTAESLSQPDLWTTKPVRVDIANRNYERIPAVYSSYVTDAPKVAVASRQVVTLRQEPEATAPTLSAEHLNWCAGHYRSFDAATNRYRAYGGQMRTCMSPFAASSSTVATTVAVSNGADSAAAAWCAARYQSYRAEDNSYQPYDGPRRVCVPAPRQVVASTAGSHGNDASTLASN
jgi:hypothetical protein